MIHRLLSIPMTKENLKRININNRREKRLKYIERILKKHKKKINLGSWFL